MTSKPVNQKGGCFMLEHYFTKPPKDDRFHSGEKERLFTESLIKEGKIERIS